LTADHTLPEDYSDNISHSASRSQGAGRSH